MKLLKDQRLAFIKRRHEAMKNGKAKVRTYTQADPELTKAKMLLLCANDLHEKRDAFTIEDLVVRCWQRFPEHFSLDGFPEYPDSHAVRYTLYGRSGLIARGLMFKVGDKLALTGAGLI